MGSLLEYLFVALLVVVVVIFVANLRPGQGNSEITHVLVTTQDQHKGSGCLVTFLIALLLLPPSIVLLRLILLAPDVVLLIGG